MIVFVAVPTHLVPTILSDGYRALRRDNVPANVTPEAALAGFHIHRPDTGATVLILDVPTDIEVEEVGDGGVHLLTKFIPGNLFTMCPQPLVNKVDPNAHYVYFHRGRRDPMEHLAVVPKELFDKLWPHAEALDQADVIPDDVQAEVDKVWDLPDLSDDFSNKDYDKIPDEHFIRVTLC